MRELTERDKAQLLTIRDVLSVQLKDDYSENGGISHIGETVRDFICDTNLKLDDSIAALNRELKICGLCPIVFKDYEEIAEEKAKKETNKVIVTNEITADDIIEMLKNSDILGYKATNKNEEDIEGVFNTLLLTVRTDTQEDTERAVQTPTWVIAYIKNGKLDESTEMIPISWLTEIGEI